MDRRQAACRGCLLGLAVGDAMGYTVDKKTWDEICRDYGPNGLLGYDLVNGSAEITSYTQMAAFVSNGLLLGIYRGRPGRYNQYIAMSLREWAKSQQFRGATEKTYCWLAQVPQMRRRLCMDTRMLDALSRETLGTPEAPVLLSTTPGALTAAAAVGLMYDPEWMEYEQVGRLGAEAMAVTHGSPEAFLAGAVLAYGIAGVMAEPETPIIQHFLDAAERVEKQFAETWPETEEVTGLVRRAVTLTQDPELTPLASLSMLGCTTAAECLAGGVYAAAVHTANFDEGMITAVNHSGRSAAVGAVTGAILGAKLGAEALPEFYLESLEQVDVLSELADDISRGRQVMRIFDDSWDLKYNQGIPAK